MKTIHLSMGIVALFALLAGVGISRAAEVKENSTTKPADPFARRTHPYYQALGKQVGGLSAEQQKAVDELERSIIEKLKANPKVLGIIDIYFAVGSDENLDKYRKILNEEQKKKFDAMRNEVRKKAREIANRAISAGNLKEIFTSILQYTNDHEGNLPADLGVLATDPGASLKPTKLISPYSSVKIPENFDRMPVKEQAQWIVKHTDYVYYGKGMNAKIMHMDTILAHEKPGLNPKGMNYVTANGYVEFVEGRQAEEIVKMIKAGINPPKDVQKNNPSF